MTNSTCSFAGCTKPRRSMNLCQGHYRQMRKGKPLAPLGVSRCKIPDEVRFWNKVCKSDGCWVWQGYKNAKGYGSFTVLGKSIGAHRYAYELVHGPIQTGFVIDHMCHNPSCVNPSHLREVSNKQNIEHRISANQGTRSGIRGVSWDESRGKWIANVTHNRVQYFLGRYDSKEEASEAAKSKRLELFTHNDFDL